MSNPDSFIEEVTEEVRRDRLFLLMRRYGWIALLLVLILVGGAAYVEWQRAKDRAAAEALGDAILDALENPEASARRTALMAIGAEGGAAGLVALLAAGEDTGSPEAAAETLEAIAADTALPELYRDLAVVKLMLLPGHAMQAGDRIARLEPLTAPGRAFRLLALELIAVARVERGETDQAIAIARDIIADGQATQDLRRRLSQLIVALGGSLDDG